MPTIEVPSMTVTEPVAVDGVMAVVRIMGAANAALMAEVVRVIEVAFSTIWVETAELFAGVSLVSPL